MRLPVIIFFIFSALSFTNAASATDSAEEISLNFDDADIFVVSHIIFSEKLKVNYFIDPNINGRITFKTSKPIKKGDLLPVISTIFRLNGVGIVEREGFYRILPLTKVEKEAGRVKFGKVSGNVRVKGLSHTHIVPLSFVTSADMLTILKPFISEGAGINEVPGKNCLIITDTDENIKRVLQIVETFDDEMFRDVTVEMFVFDNLSVKDVVEELKGSFPVFGLTDRESLKLRYVPIERLNALLVVTPSEKHLDQIRKWIRILDSAFEGAKPRVYVYPLQNSDADYVAEILNKIIYSDSKSTSSKRTRSSSKSSKKTSSSNPFSTKSKKSSTSSRSKTTGNLSTASFVSSETKIIHDEYNNSLIILALPKDYKFIEDLIKKIDIVPRQVMIEVLIAEVRLTDELQFGIQWYLGSHFSAGSNDLSGVSIFGDSSSSLFDWAGSDSTVNLSSPGFTFAASDSDDGLVRALIQALAAESMVTILSSPVIMVSDNREARIQVGDQVPVETGTTYSDSSTTTTVQYRDTGSVLSVKPKINDGGLISLEIKQEVSTVSDASGVQGNPIFSNKLAETEVVVQNGRTLIIGGLISSQNTTSESGIPLLKDLPWIGSLFKSTSDSNDRSELIILITPHTVESVDDAEKAKNDFVEKLQNIKKAKIPLEGQ